MRGALWALVGFALILALIKVVVAASLSPFGDEAFYWQESRQLAWSYSDVPPATALLIRAGETLFGHSVLGMRSVFLLLGTWIPLQLFWLGRRHCGTRVGAIAALGWMLLPLGGSLGVLALPDVPLTFAALQMLTGLCWVATAPGWRAWGLLGAAIALAWLSHYRAAMLLLAGLGMLACSRVVRDWWGRPGLWWALLLGLTGLLPLLLFNLDNGWAGLSFQLVDRHPWQFHADALIQPLEQAVVCTPLLYALLLYSLWHGWHQRDESPLSAVLAWAAAAVVVGYWLFGLFADDLRFRVHWPLPGYMPLLLLLAVQITRANPGRLPSVFKMACVVAAAGLFAVLGYFALAASVPGTTWLANYKAFPANFVGWNEAASRTRHWLAAPQANPPSVLVADNFLLAAELSFALDDAQPVYALDHPLNRKHGRAVQLALWQRDEQGLRRQQANRPVLLVVEESAGRLRERAAWLQSLCGRLADIEPIDRLSLFQARKEFAWYRARVPAPGEVVNCTAADVSAGAPAMAGRVLHDVDTAGTQQPAQFDQG